MAILKLKINCTLELPYIAHNGAGDIGERENNGGLNGY